MYDCSMALPVTRTNGINIEVYKSPELPLFDHARVSLYACVIFVISNLFLVSFQREENDMTSTIGHHLLQKQLMYI